MLVRKQPAPLADPQMPGTDGERRFECPFDVFHQWAAGQLESAHLADDTRGERLASLELAHAALMRTEGDKAETDALLKRFRQDYYAQIDTAVKND